MQPRVGRWRGRAQPGRVSCEIRDIHASALCEKYGNNIAEAKQNRAPAYEICGIALLQSRRPPLLLIHLGTTAAAFRVYSFSLFKAPHLPRSRERAPDPDRHRRLNTNASPARSRAERSGDAILGELAARNRNAALLRSGGNVTSGRRKRGDGRIFR